MSWDDTLKAEQTSIKAKCELADIEFEFVVDASGSVGIDNWQLSMNQIAEYWIRGAIQPNGAAECGNHVAARRYSSNSDDKQVLWHDFAPPPRSKYPQFQNYTEYVASVFENEAYTGGGTYTAEALRRTRMKDIPRARRGKKFVMVFTDGVSSDSSQVQSEANQLKSVVDEVYAFGNGTGINENELQTIASNKTRGYGWEVMDDFSKYEYFIRNFILIQGGCDTEFIKPFRTDDGLFFCHNLKQRTQLFQKDYKILYQFFRTIDIENVKTYGLSEGTAIKQFGGMCGMGCEQYYNGEKTRPWVKL